MDQLANSIKSLSPEQRELLSLLLHEQGGQFNAFPLSFAQQRLWFLNQLEPGNPAYNIAAAVHIQGPLALEALERSFQEVVRRHESLRTSFTNVEGKPVQIIAPELELTVPVNDLSGLAESEKEIEIERLAQAEARYHFELTSGPLLNVRVLRLKQDEHVLLVTIHHIVSDGWSIGVLIREVAALYDAFLMDAPSPLDDIPIQYADYARWQQSTLTPEALQDQLDYWKKQLGGELPVLSLPTDLPRPSAQSNEGTRYQIQIPPDQSEALEALCRREGATLFMTLLAVFKVLLHRYTGQTDISVGSSIAGRNRAEVEGLIGFFLNSLVLRTDLSDNPTFLELLARVRETALQAYAHQDVPIEMLIDTLHPARDLSHNPLFQVMFIFQNTPAPALHLSNLTLTPMEIDTGTAKFDLTFDLKRTANGIAGWIEYNTDLFDPATIARMDKHFQQLIEGIVANPAQRISDLPLLTRAEQQQLESWSHKSPGISSRSACVHHLFEEQVLRTPDRTAVRHETQILTYHQLNQRAGKVANYLRARGVGPEVVVGICFERSLEMIVSLLGILKAGAAYLPLDPGYPSERLAYMIADAGVGIVLTEANIAKRLATPAVHTICLDGDFDPSIRRALTISSLV